MSSNFGSFSLGKNLGCLGYIDFKYPDCLRRLEQLMKSLLQVFVLDKDMPPWNAHVNNEDETAIGQCKRCLDVINLFQ